MGLASATLSYLSLSEAEKNFAQNIIWRILPVQIKHKGISFFSFSNIQISS